ncbi:MULTISPECIES: 4-hydroxy-tetrahydrodipicolinate synthase [unclassified Sporosarcina]|uniref:4-hydroxy-tetrahydrodipicolinate synthase n=1 Tax=unclassified Sporosarcina TaxID=2647733 RepID=UPI000C171187|nr:MULTISPECIES: 4-hydroxy-tetrahydrodipicolinate synthase [unclassified Sporosarcina]PID05842.1 4-hydroxy-tetrahydrodipicolinate synthase [Sporosarcina sp. P30]PID09036.1 4-hydroxy-tetrahydrodipicolinate synthase [Sporosarcina sp. P31]PID12333.1 4-hydroxy-tetrahydrodipicolinate synthase [Sporosarcina sp. P32b]
MNFGSIMTAMVTPFDEKGDIDYPATQNLINHLLANGTDALVIAGTTGESPTLTAQEKVELFKFTVQTVAGRAPVIAGTGTNSTRESIDLTIQAEEAGVDGIMLVVPYYNKPCQEGLYQHFKTIAQTTTLPVMLYNIPGRSAVNMLPETIIRLANNVSNITSVKEASGDLEAAAAIIEHTGDDFFVYSGDDASTLPMLSIGGTGIVSVSAHIIGNEMQEMVRHFKTGNTKQAATIYRGLLPIMKAMFAAPNPSPTKAALNLTGVPVGGVRLPMIALPEEQVDSLRDLLALRNQSAVGL